jgi:hypothetical protein
MKENADNTPCISIELAALVDAEDKEDFFGVSESAVEYDFVVPLRRPDPRSNAQVEAVLHTD